MVKKINHQIITSLIMFPTDLTLTGNDLQKFVQESRKR